MNAPMVTCGLCGRNLDRLVDSVYRIERLDDDRLRISWPVNAPIVVHECPIPGAVVDEATRILAEAQ